MSVSANDAEFALLATKYSNSDRLPFGNPIDELILAILSGRISVRARNVQTGLIQLIPARELNELEFYIATDIPGNPFGFRRVADQLLRWVAPMVSAADAMAFWPQYRSGNDASTAKVQAGRSA
jgi:hypothetical protein